MVSPWTRPQTPTSPAYRPPISRRPGPSRPPPAGKLEASVAKLIPSRIVNELVTFVPIELTFNISSNTVGLSSRLCRTIQFQCNALLTNTSNPPLSNLAMNVTTLTNGNLLQNAYGGPGGVGNTLTIPRVGNFSDGVLSPGEFVDVPFSICLKNQESFNFFVDVHVLK